jgi:hypothetical protein
MQAPTNDPVIAKLREAFNAMEAEFKTYTDQEKEEVIKLGGLHVVGTERHESRRIDNQVTGRDTVLAHNALFKWAPAKKSWERVAAFLFRFCKEEGTSRGGLEESAAIMDLLTVESGSCANCMRVIKYMVFSDYLARTAYLLMQPVVRGRVRQVELPR